MSEEGAVVVQDLSKVFRDPVLGKHKAVDGISFTARYGRIFGLLGPNAAGKTTTLRMLATILTPTSGTIRIAGFEIDRDPAEVRRHIGFVTASTGVYERMSPREVMRFFGRLYDIDVETLEARIEDLLVRFDLVRDADRLCGTLSSGTRQKVNVARSVVHNPPVLIFDEPTANLDCVVARTVVDFLESCKEQGKSIILSSHRMEEVERLCNDAAIIEKGTIRAVGSLEELQREWNATTLEEVFFAAIDRRAGGEGDEP